MIRHVRMKKSDLESIVERIRKSLLLADVCGGDLVRQEDATVPINYENDSGLPAHSTSMANEHKQPTSQHEDVPPSTSTEPVLMEESVSVPDAQSDCAASKSLPKRILEINLRRCDRPTSINQKWLSGINMEIDEVKPDAKDEIASTSVTGGKASPGVKRKKIVYKMEPRTPLKRQRIPVQRFQSPAEIEVPTKSKVTKDEVSVLFKKGMFLAVRGDDSTGEGRFYICKAAQNVYSSTRNFKIQWLNLDQSPNIYCLDYMDQTEIECVLTNLRLERISRDTYRLPHDEQIRIETILDKALKVERGELIVEDFEKLIKKEMAMDGVDDHDDELDDEPTQKKPKIKKPVAVKLKATKAKLESTKDIQKGSNKMGKEEKGKKFTDKMNDKKSQSNATKKKTGSTEKKMGPDKKLKPNPKIKVLEKEPLFETKESVPFISKTAHSKLVIRAVLLNDMASLKTLLADRDHLYRIDLPRSCSQEKTALHYAIDAGNKEAIQLLVRDMSLPCDKNERMKDNSSQPELIHSMGTGCYNPVSLGISGIRNISMSRGCREGNNAFLKDLDNEDPDFVIYALKKGVSRDILELLISSQGEEDAGRVDRLEEISTIFENIYEAVLSGHRGIAGQLVEESMKAGGDGFGFLHKEVLQFETEDLRKNIMMASIAKKSYENKKITPLHCACINPNVKYLRNLLSLFPNPNLEDRDHRRPIHYAAVCVSTAPLQFLIDNGASPQEADTSGRIALHWACHANRPHNVDLLLKLAQKNASDNDILSKWGLGGVNRPDRSSICPLHLAVSLGNVDIVKILLKYGVDVNKPLSAYKNRCTPLMLAAAMGHLDIARLLVQSGAVVEQKDKLKRTALIHAAMNGNTNVLSYLLFLGADPDAADSSSNTALHYAAAYGWYFCVRMLVNDAGADVKKSNDWKITPVGIAFLKGHVGLVDFLLKQPESNINFKNDQGMTLISVAVASELNGGLYGQIEYLLKKGANPRIEDSEECNSLHHLASNTVYDRHRAEYEKKMDFSVQLAEKLLEAGCDPTAKASDGKTAVMIAIERVNIKLVKLLVEKGGTVSRECNESKQNILHQMALGCMKNDYGSLLEILIKQKPDKNRIVEEIMEVHGIKTDQQKAKIVDEIMEVDGLKAEEAKMPENSVPMNGHDMPMDEGRMTNAQMIRMMTREVDVEGRTPLLTACHKYKHDDKEAHGELGRAFIKILIELARADVIATVQKRSCEEDERVDDNWSAVHYMTMAKLRDKLQNTSPGLELVLQHKPALELVTELGKTALCIAVEDNRVLETKLLLKAGANPNVSYRLKKKGADDSENSRVNIKGTPLLIAALNGSFEMIPALVEAGASVNVKTDRTLETPLHLLLKHANVTKGMVDSVKALVKAGADLHCKDDAGSLTPLHLAVTHRENEGLTVEITDVLLNAKADINAIDKNSRTPLHLAVNANSGKSNSSTDLEELLIHCQANTFVLDVHQRLPLHYAFVKIGRWTDESSLDPIDLCQVLTSAMDGKKIDLQDSFGQTPLHRAAHRGAAICCMHLIQRKANVFQTDRDGNTPLSHAVTSGHDSCAIMLIQKGADVNDMYHVDMERLSEEKEKKVEKKKKPLWTLKHVEHKRIYKNYSYSMFQSAIASELPGLAHIILDVAGLERKHLEAAVATANFHVCLRLLKRIRDNRLLQASNEKGQNLLHCLANVASCGTSAEVQLKVAKLFIERGVSASQVDCYGCTPLFYAALNHHQIPLCSQFIDSVKSLDINRKNNFGRTVLASFFWNISKITGASAKPWIELFVSKGASLDVLFNHPIEHHYNTVIDTDLDYFEKHTESAISPVILAINVFDMELLRFLLKSGASPNMPDSQGLTPLMHAVKLNVLGLIKVLLNFDYDPAKDIVENDGSKSELVKRSSRMAFQVKRDETIVEDKAEQEEEESQSGPEEENAKNEPEDEENEEDSEKDEEASEEEASEEEDNEDNENEEDSEEDHDTDVVDSEEEEDTHKNTLVDALPRLGSKQPSLLKQGSSVKKDDFPVVVKTSSVELDFRDGRGWTAIHHLVCPLDYGSYDREEILYVLAKAGANTQLKDNAGLTPLAHALIRGTPKIAKRLQLLQGVETDKMEKPTYSTFEVEDNLVPSHSFDYEKDAAEMLKTLEAEANNKKKIDNVKRKCLPDKNCGFKEIAEVAQDLEQNIPYDAVGTKTDVSAGAWGLYNFYRLQLLYIKGKDIYVLFTRWGRIGDTGQYQHTPFQKRTEAVLEFCKIFRAKTGNYWSNVKTFDPQLKKYRLVEQDEEQEKHDDVKLQLESDLPSNLNEYTQDLMKEMSSVQMLANGLQKVVKRNIQLRFGWIKKEALHSARKVLQEVAELITTVDKQATSLLTTNMDEYRANCEKLYALSNEYYSLMPSSDYTDMRIPPITTHAQVKTHTNMLVALMDIELASKILLGAQHRIKEINPLDYVYHCIGCKIQLMKEDDIESQNILKFISSSESTRVQAMYKVSRPGEDERLGKLNQDNHRLLWHGSDMSNFISILSRGLLRAPPEVSITGHLFGEGIYNADVFSKSKGYCRNFSPTSDVQLVLLSEVSLGNMKVSVDSYDTDIKDTEINSIKIAGKKEPDSVWNVSLPYGAVLPLGDIVNVQKVGEQAPRMQYNEYIVQDPAQICLRYLIEFR